MKWQLVVVDLSLEVNMDLICKHHDASTIFLNPSHEKGNRLIKRGVRILMKCDGLDESSDLEIHPDSNIWIVAYKHLPDFPYRDELIVLASNMIDLDWGLMYGQHLITNGAHSISLFEETNLTLNELRKLMCFRMEQKQSSLIFNAYKKNEKSDNTSMDGRGTNKFLIDKTRQVTLDSKDEIDSILDHIIDYKIKSLTLNPLLQDLIRDDKIETFDLETIDCFLETVTISFKEANALNLFKEKLTAILYEFINNPHKKKNPEVRKEQDPEKREKNPKEQNKLSLIYSILLVFGFISPDQHEKDDSPHKKAKYIGSLLSRNIQKSHTIAKQKNKLSKAIDSDERMRLLQEIELAGKKQYPLIKEGDIQNFSKEDIKRLVRLKKSF